QQFASAAVNNPDCRDHPVRCVLITTLVGTDSAILASLTPMARNNNVRNFAVKDYRRLAECREAARKVSAEKERAGLTIAPFLSRLTRRDLIGEGGWGVRTVAVRKNEDIIVAGNHYEFVYVNNDGWLFRYKILHNGSRQIIDFILPGQVFGL